MKRNVNLDLLRFLGVLIIMVAHAGPPGWLYQLRNFGTPLLVVGSALSYALIYSQRDISTMSFLKKRLSRLVFPAWIFLSIFFAVFFLVFSITGLAYPFSNNEIVGSYTFYNGIGFVWVLKIYIILALFTPVALRLSQSSLSSIRYFLTLLVAYSLYELFLYFVVDVIPVNWLSFFNTVVLILPPYFLLYLYGMRASRLSNAQLLCVIVTSLLSFIGLAVLNYVDASKVVPTQLFKYPPRLYYLSYAFFALNTVYLLTRNLVISNSRLRAIVTWLSANSLWIYLWHIMAFYIWLFLVGDTNGKGLAIFSVKAIFLLSFGVLMAYTQLRLVNAYADQNTLVGRRLSGLLT